MAPRRKRLTERERRTVYGRMGGHCAYCGRELPYKEMQVDHVVPLRKGGSDALDNMLPACRSCNHYKHSMDLEGFRRLVEMTPYTLSRDSVTYRNAVRFGLVEPRPHTVTFYFEESEEKEES